jgi:hypothetical protein
MSFEFNVLAAQPRAWDPIFSLSRGLVNDRPTIQLRVEIGVVGEKARVNAKVCECGHPLLDAI